jgi:hypothetical protein
MANRFPLIANSSSNQIQELANADNLDLTGNNIVGVVDINADSVTTDEVKVIGGGTTTFIKSTSTGIRLEDVDNDPIGLGISFISITSPDADGLVTTTKANRYYFSNTSAGVITAHLPHPVNIGDYVRISDASGTFNTNSLFIVPNDSATGPATVIQGALTSLEADVQYATATLTYTGISSTGWMIK